MMKIVSVYLRLTKKPRMSTTDRARAVIAEPKATAEPPRKLVDRHSVTSAQFGAFTSYTVGGRAARSTVIYVHGGSYIAEIAPQHWDLVSEMADHGLRVEVPVYGLAPQCGYRDAYAFLKEHYANLRHDVPARDIIVMGDSAGAGLALGFAQSLLAEGEAGPGRLVLISPWLDLTMTNPAIPAVERRDPWLTRVGLIESGLAWADGDDPSAPKLSPINGSMAGLPPTEVYIGTHDILHPDVMTFRDRAEASGVDIRVTECPGAVHVYPVVPAPEGKRARTAIMQSL